MKKLKKIFVFLLILICPIIASACSLGSSSRDSKYGPIKLRGEKNIESFAKGLANSSVKLEGNNITFNFSYSLVNRVKAINEKVEIKMVVKYFIVFRNAHGETERKEWKDLDLIVTFNEIEFDEDEPDKNIKYVDEDPMDACDFENEIAFAEEELRCFNNSLSKTIVYPGVYEIYNGGIELQYYVSATGEVFCPRPPEESGELVEEE